ncbi:MAG: T9SS type A sorting domain-containing protein [Saprospiraceae bacterium]
MISSTEDLPVPTAIQAYPNPTKDVAKVTWTTTVAGDFQWQLMDMNGRVVGQQRGAAIQGEQSLDVDMSHLPNGIYLFRLQSGKEQQTLRLSKCKLRWVATQVVTHLIRIQNQGRKYEQDSRSNAAVSFCAFLEV